MWEHVNAEGHWTGEIWSRRKGGELFAGLLTISLVPSGAGELGHYVLLFFDITKTKDREDRLEHLAHYDPLTNLPNRLLLSDRLHQAMAMTSRRGQHVAVAYIDLDGFKKVNDHYGHDIGDLLLVTVASRMKHELRESDTLARVGGDEFVAVLVDIQTEQQCEPLLNRLLASASAPFDIAGLSLNVSASIGVVLSPQSENIEGEVLLQLADQAMYRAKQAGKNRIEYHR